MVTARPGAGGAVGTGPSPQSAVNGGLGGCCEYRETASDGDDDDDGDGDDALLPRTPVWDSGTGRDSRRRGRAAVVQRGRADSGQGEAKDNNNEDINNRANVMYKGGLNERQSEGDEQR